MLKELSIKNFAIIDDIKIEFTDGLNLLTGETGSGKSIIIEALGIVLGGRSSKDIIRTGEDKAIIEALFYTNDDINQILENNGYEGSDVLIITKEIYTVYPSISRVNGRPITLSILSNITNKLVDIFGQHEHQSLLNVSNHIKLIDSMGDADFYALKALIQNTYDEYKKLKDRLSEMNISSYEREREIDLLKFQIDEIEEANLTVTDDSEVEEEYKKLSNIINITSNLKEIIGILSDNTYNSNSILDMIDNEIALLGSINKFDKDLEPYFSRFEEVRYELQDLSRDLNAYLENLDIDEERLAFLTDRLDLVNRLKKKYGQTIEKIINYKGIIANDYEKLINYEKEIEILNKSIQNYEKILTKDSNILSNKRKDIAIDLQYRITLELRDLNMNDVVFNVSFREKEEPSYNGLDLVEFLISTNPGEDLKPLSKIVSGGEMSRIMLGFKSIMADNDKMPTLIFDEIDTGISGRTAQIVGEKIKKISKNHQVISISHLPQIAAMADSHYVISKSLSNNKAITKIERLSEEERIIEMARLLGGVDVTETTLEYAKEMIDMSKKLT